MFDGLLRSKFSKKCKNKLKCIKLRIGPIKSKKQAIVKIQKKDVADLLAAGHQEKAFARIDALCTDINLVHCYEIIEKYCEFIQSQLPILQKQRECPDDVAEAMSTLIYAAARFPDLPELCDLRHIFIRRYGSNIELYVNAEFMKKVQKKLLSKEEKLQIMQEIADEFSVNWNSKEFDQKSCTPPPEPKAEPMPLHTKIEEHSTVIGLLKSEIQSMVKEEPNRVNIVKQAQSRNLAMEPAEPYQLKKIAIPPYTKQNINQISSFNGDNLDEDQLHGRTPKVHKDPNGTGPQHQQPTIDNPFSLVPPYTKPNGSNNRYHIDEKIGEEHEKGQLKAPIDKGRAINMIPPYVKPRHSELSAQINSRLENSVVNDRPMSMRTVRKPIFPVTNNVHAFDDDKPTGLILDNISRNGGTPRIIGYNDEESKERVKVKETQRRSETEEDRATYYGKLLSRLSSEQRRQGDFQTPAICKDEMLMDRLLAHYSNKGVARHVRSASVPTETVRTVKNK